MTHTLLSRRSLTMEDAEDSAAISTAVSQAAAANEIITAASLRQEWSEPRFELSRSSLGIFQGEALQAFAVFYAQSEPPVRPRLQFGVDPALNGAELRAELLAWADEMAQSVIPRCPPEARVGLWSGAHTGYRPDEIALRAAGYQERRIWHEMRIDMSAPPAPSQLPPGFCLRPYRHEEDLPLLVDIVRDSFSDHFGHIDQSFERDLEAMGHWLNNDPAFDPKLVLLAADEKTGDAVACALPMTDYLRRPGLGYIDMVGTRRACRRRGLASALLRMCFALYWERGTRSVCLEVDGASLTNAVALYERAGMHVSHSFASYEKLLRDGVELAKVSME